MIDRIEGSVAEIDPTHVVVMTGGIGLHLSISLQTFENIKSSKTVYLFTYLHVREDNLQLFGFFEKAERETFKILIGMSGIGPRVGQALLSALTLGVLHDSVNAGDWKRLTAAPGVGRKLAERMTVELRGKFGAISEIATLEDSPVYVGSAGVVNDAVQALIALGHSSSQAEKLAAKAAKNANDDVTLEEIIRNALKG